jgi:hypothetical protein
MKIEIVGGYCNQTLSCEQIEQIIIQNNYDGFVVAEDLVFIVSKSRVVCLTSRNDHPKTGYFYVKAFCHLDIRARLV